MINLEARGVDVALDDIVQNLSGKIDWATKSNKSSLGTSEKDWIFMQMPIKGLIKPNDFFMDYIAITNEVIYSPIIFWVYLSSSISLCYCQSLPYLSYSLYKCFYLRLLECIVVYCGFRRRQGHLWCCLQPRFESYCHSSAGTNYGYCL